MAKNPQDNYQELMNTVRFRLDSIKKLRELGVDNMSITEIAAFHARKIIEGIAFGCLIALEKGINHVPRDAQGQYNAETILKALQKKGIDVFPSPSEIREATKEEQKTYNTKIVVEGVASRRLTQSELINKYQRMHNWLHELNPYTKEDQEIFHKKHQAQLWKDIQELEDFLLRHFISIKGQGFYCTLRDKIDGLTKVISLSKISEL